MKRSIVVISCILAAAGATGQTIFETPSYYSVGNQPRSAIFSDLNGDSFVDIVAANQSDMSLSVLLNDQDGTFTPGTGCATPAGPWGLASADFNDDLCPDVAAVCYGSGRTQVRLNHSITGVCQATLISPATYDDVHYARAVVTGLLDDDDQVDFAVADYNEHRVQIRMNNADGTGTFGNKIFVSVGNLPRGITAGDIDDDLDIDLITANAGSHTISILYNDGTGVFGNRTDLAVGTNPYDVCIADFDVDGFADIATANTGSDDVSVLLNNGNNTFTLQSPIPAGDGSGSICSGYLDSDSHIDLAVSNNNSHTVSLLIGAGDGSFAVEGHYSSGGGYYIDCADVDNDSDVDLVVTNVDADRVAVLKNTLSEPTDFCNDFDGLFCDDFEEYASTDDPEFISIWSHSTEYGTGTVSITAHGPGNALTLSNPGDEWNRLTTISTFPLERVVECEVMSNDFGQSTIGEDYYGAALIAYFDDITGNAVTLQYVPVDQCFRAIYVVEGVPYPEQYATCGSGIDIGLGQWYRLKTEISSTAISYYYDLGSGYVHLCTHEHTLPELEASVQLWQGGFDAAEASFDNLTVRNPDPSSAALVSALSELDQAVQDYLLDNSTLAWNANGLAYTELGLPEHEKLDQYWEDLLTTTILGGGEEANIGLLEKLMEEHIGVPESFPSGLVLYAQNVLYQIQRIRSNMLMDELLEKALSGEPLSLDYHQEEVIIDHNQLSVEDAISTLIPPSIPATLDPDFPQNQVVSKINAITEDINSVRFCCPMSVDGKLERSNLWYMPESCDLSSAYNYTVGTDIQQAMRYYVALDELTNANKWDAVHQSLCSEEAEALAYGAKVVTMVAGVALLLTDGGATLGVTEALYNAYGAACTLLGYHSLSLKYDKTSKLAHSLLEYNSSWPDALMAAVDLRNKIVNDIVAAIENPQSEDCATDIVIESIDVPDKVCADFLTQFVDVPLSITVRNNDPSREGFAKVFTELYAVGDNNIAHHFRTDSSQIVTVSPTSSHQFTATVKVIANGLLFENDNYQVAFRVVTSGSILTVSRTFECQYDWQCELQDYLDDSRDVNSGFVESEQTIVGNFGSSVGAKLNRFTLWWPGSDLNLHVFDESGNHVGFNDTTQLVELEIPGASYSGTDSYPEVVSLPDPLGQYDVWVEAVELVDSEYFSVEVYEEFEHLPVVLPVVPSVNLVGVPGDSVYFDVVLSEAGGHSPALLVTATLSELVSDLDDTLTGVYLEFPTATIDADGHITGEGYVLSGSLDAPGWYTGEIGVTYDGGAFDLPVYLNLVIPSYTCCIPPSVGDLDRSGQALPYNVDGIDLSIMIDMLFISLIPVECIDEADIDFSCNNSLPSRPCRDPYAVDGIDLSYMIDALFISLNPLPQCDGSSN